MMKVVFYIGITALVYLFAATGLANAALFAPASAVFIEYSAFIFIALGIMQTASVVLLIRPKTRLISTLGESTLLVSSLILLMSNQILFVICNLVLVLSSKLVFAKTSENDQKKSAHQAAV